MPVGAYGGRKEIMDYVSPMGPVYQAGTLSGNPIAMTAGLAMLSYLNDHSEVYVQLETATLSIVQGIKENIRKLNLNYSVNHIGSMFSLFFTSDDVTDFDSAKKSDTKLFGQYFQLMLEKGIYLAPSQYESLFVSTSIKENEIKRIVQANYEAMKELDVLGNK